MNAINNVADLKAFVAAARMADLITIYNANASKQVSRFADRATAEKRVIALMTPIIEAAKGAPTATGATDPTDRRQNPTGTIADRKEVKEAAKGKPAAVKKVAKETKTPVDRAAAIAASWANPEVAAARAMRHKVKVGGEVYRSVREAFKALGLPDSQHIKFRMELKANGKATFQGHRFTLVDE